MNVDDLFKEISDLAKGELKQYGDEITDVIRDFYKNTKKDIEKYTRALADAKISQKEYASLLRQKEQLLQAVLLTEKVKKQVNLKEFQDRVIGFIIDKVFDALP